MEKIKTVYRATITGCPRTKKNSPQIRRDKNGKRYVVPSDAFLSYQDAAGWQLHNIPDEPLNGRYNIVLHGHSPAGGS